jgi:hypothetical protein
MRPEESYARLAARMGAAADKELAAARTRVNKLKARVTELEAQLAKQAGLLETLKASQQTRGRQLEKSVAREAELRAQLIAAGLVERDPAGPGTVRYLGQQRTAGSLLGP